jgi:hypothetical protein
VDIRYVDEAQDNLLIDALRKYYKRIRWLSSLLRLLVLRLVCKNPQGLFWAGDTAQTISVGSSFRMSFETKSGSLSDFPA